jgi:hypothetical protein
MANGLFAGVLDPVRRINLANDAPVLLIIDWDESVFVLEFRFQR